MKRKLQGKYQTISTVGESVKAFIPAPLPPKPDINWTNELREKFDRALIEIGRLDGISSVLPETSLFLYMYVRKEAVLSSMIEGTQSSLSDLLLFEIDLAPGVPIEDVQEVSNYVSALDFGLSQIRNGFPLSSRLLRDIHAKLLAKGRGMDKDPGQFRRSQNWIGGTRPGNAVFVPPPPEHVQDCMSDLEKFLHDKAVKSSTLLKAALAHIQFETIHPFLDGNGRVGRLLITLILCAEKILREPILYLSLYFKQHRRQYYELLNGVRDNGDWESWLEFFADAVIYTSSQAVETANRLIDIAENDRIRIKEIGRASGSVLKVHHALLEKPIASASILAGRTGLSIATVNKSLSALAEVGIVKELTGFKRNRVFIYTEYVDVLSRGIALE